MVFQVSIRAERVGRSEGSLLSICKMLFLNASVPKDAAH